MNSKLYSLIQEDGFVFDKYSCSEELKKLVLQNNFPTKEIKEALIKILQNFSIPTNKLQVVFEDFTQNQFNDMHTHLIAADFQVLIWITEDEGFIGRDFLYCKNDGPMQRFKPSNGSICFMKTNDLSFSHGVSKLESDNFVRTIIISVNCNANKGEHLTVSSNLKPI